MPTYQTLLTTAGGAALADSIANGTTITFTEVAIGDGQNDPVEGQTALQNEVYRASVTSVGLDPSNPDQVVVTLTLPPEDGGFTIREVGVFTSGGLFAVGRYPDSYKPLLAEGSGKALTIDIILAVSNLANITFEANPSGLVQFSDLANLAPRYVGLALYLTPGTYTFTQGVDCPANVFEIWVEIWGPGGGGGSGTDGYYTGGAGGGGGYAKKKITLAAGESVTITVGAGGAAGVSGNGGNGETTSFGAYCSATGGTGGTGGGTSTHVVGLGGQAVGGDENFDGEEGWCNYANRGGRAHLGGKGGLVQTGAAATDGEAPGAGGGAGYKTGSQHGGAGAPGGCRVTW